MLIRKVRNALKLLRQDPKLFRTTVAAQLLGKSGGPGPSSRAPANQVSKTLNDAILEIEQAGIKQLLVYGSSDFYQSVRESLPSKTMDWASSNFSDFEAGAQNINKTDVGKFDGILVGGPNVNSDYRHVLRRLYEDGCCLPVFWVADRFEFCAGTLPVPAECSDADALIFNHFDDYFGLSDPLLLRVEVFDQVCSKAELFLLPPRECLRINLNQWLPDRRGPACIVHRTVHPVLTRGRHYRWRATANLHWKDSVTTLHGGHDFRGPGAGNEFKINKSIVNNGQVVFTLPNYNLDVSQAGIPVECVDGDRYFEVRRAEQHRVDQISFRRNGENAGFNDFVGCRYTGYGASFWFAMGEKYFDEKAGANNLCSNHSIRASLRTDPNARKPVAPRRALLERLSQSRIFPAPHALPVTSDECPVQFGFQFDANVPSLTRFVVYLFDHNGNEAGSFAYEKTHPGPVFVDDLLAEAKINPNDKPSLMLVSPDWISMDCDPVGMAVSGDLVARHRKSLDFDVTEFQSCWRNLGVKVSEFPHWLSQDRMLAGSAHVQIGVQSDSGSRPAVLIVNGSGSLNYSKCARAHLALINRSGNEISVNETFVPFTHRLIWLDEAFPDYGSHLDGGYGTLIVRSRDADLNANLMVLWNDSSVSLQHMWGY